MILLQKRMNRANKVRIHGPTVDLRFSIKGIGALLAEGKRNIPDGEVFTCPIKDSVQGHIQLQHPHVYSGTRLKMCGSNSSTAKIVKATSNNNKRINEILDTDAGARYIGEFSLGFNPYILNPMCDILFDEKIAGSLHFTPGQAYEDADNGNRSAVHWDLVLIQRPEYGGGEVWFDDELIRKELRMADQHQRILAQRDRLQLALARWIRDQSQVHQIAQHVVINLVRTPVFHMHVHRGIILEKFLDVRAARSCKPML